MIKSYRDRITLYRNTKNIKLEVVTYKNDGHFYYKLFRNDTERITNNLQKITKGKLLEMIKTQGYKEI